jgi:hypothetical protein
MKIKLIISVLLSLGVAACATQYKDAVTIFHIKGRALDQTSNFPLEDVEVYFIDTGYDDTLSKQQKPFKIGQSGSRGKINIRFNYWWGRQTSVFEQRPQATFDIVLSRASFEEQRLHFKESALKTDGVIFLVDLADVYLVRKNE